jgi:hypothetical protein
MNFAEYNVLPCLQVPLQKMSSLSGIFRPMFNLIQIPCSYRLRHSFRIVLFCCAALFSAVDVQAQETTVIGQWTFNQADSDVTDRKVEDALRAMGQKVNRSWFSRDREKYRGGPPEQELYDRISYDSTLTIETGEEFYLFTYDDNWERPVYLDDRARSVSLNNLGNVEDFSFAHWENTALLVEGRPRDGGFSNERYSVSNDGKQLTVEIYAMPGSFTAPVEVTRVYDRIP